jgi:LDH2 family malate/lactate/ureidoglycolate dehydrogenase
MNKIPFSVVRAAVLSALSRAGVNPQHSEIQAALLLYAELRERPSHGLLRLPRVIERIRNGVTDPETEGEHIWHGNFLEVDGLNGLGPVVASKATSLLCDKVQEDGIAIAAIRSNNHLGMLAWYGEQVAQKKLILLGICNSEALVHPWGGRKAMLGTNPITIAIPTDNAPFIMDMATGLVSMGKIHDYALNQRPLPLGWAIDEIGDPTTDANRAKNGAIAPFGGAKGYALGLAFEILVGTLTKSAVGRSVKGTLDSNQLCNKGDVFIVINPNMQGDTTSYISTYLNEIRNSGDGGNSVLVPGDRAVQAEQKNLEEGLSLPSDLWEKIQQLSDL